MSERRLASTTRRTRHNLDQIRAAPTKDVRFSQVCRGLVAEALRKSNTDRLTDITNAVLDLLYRIQHRLPLPDPAQGSPTIDDLTTPRAPRWHARGATPDQ